MAYVTALLTFIDVLGFRDLVNKDPTGTRVVEVIAKLRSFGCERADSYNKAAALHFSGCVVRFTPLEGGAGFRSDRAALLREVEDLTYLQGELAAADVLLRGGIASGLAHADPTGVFGPAFIESYTLERDHARYPRIILHPALMAAHATEGEDGRRLYADADGLALTRVGDDGFDFIDYLGNFPREVHDEEFSSLDKRHEIARSYMLPRKRRIEEAVKKAALLDPVRVKYVWLARYHNEVAKEILGANAAAALTDC